MKPTDDLEFDDYLKNENKMIKEDNKIIHNSYNSGEIDFENFIQPMRVDDSVYDLYKDTISENLIEERIYSSLQQQIYDHFCISPYYDKYKNPKRVDKNDMKKMYYYFKDLLVKENTYSPIQIFIGFAEFFQINYNQLYDEVGTLDKEGLLKELNEKFNLQKKIKTKKLF